MGGEPSAAATTITASPTEIKADGVSTSNILVQVKDTEGGPVHEGGHSVNLVTSLGTLSAVTDRNDGTYTATLTAGTTNGTARISGSMNGAKISTGDALVTFLP
jgi:adhesin/invasin